MCIFAQAAQVPFFGALWVLDQFFDGEGGRGSRRRTSDTCSASALPSAAR